MRSHRLELVVSLFLIVAILAVFWQVRNHKFVSLDDNMYVTENDHVQAGITFEGVIWAFTTAHAGNWHPLTWLSHMLDCQIYGLDAGGHHCTNLLLHLANTLLLFVVLRRMTRLLWRSAFVAALFAVHPLHVESVAWVAERKDVLSTFFWMLTMWTYVSYVERPSTNRYLQVLLAFTLGLMSKPMLVTLPFALLLLDYWPLDRFQTGQSGDAIISQNHKDKNPSNQRSHAFRLVWEKVPLIAVAAASSVVTCLAQHSSGALSSLDMLPLKIRFANASVAYIRYIGKMIWPNHLAVFYPHPAGNLAIWQIVGATLLLASISALVIRAVYRCPYLPVGWLWYLGTLVPVIGVVQVGSQSMADRYTYVPLIGLFIIAAWGGPELLARRRYQKTVLAMSAGVLVSILMTSARSQLQHWKNSTTLFEHALEVTARNYLAHNNLGIVLAAQGKLDEAIAHLSEALRLRPDDPDAHYNLGLDLAQQGKFGEAIAHYRNALRIRPNDPDIHNNLGFALAGQGKLPEAVWHLSKALQIKPDLAEAHYNLGIVLDKQGKLKGAMSRYSKALKIKPVFAKAHNNLGIALVRQGRLDEAIAHFSEALRIKPDFAQAQNNLRRASRLAQKPKKTSNTPAGE